MAIKAKNIIEVKDLKKYFSGGGIKKSSPLKAVDGVSFSISKGETLGLVGESGSGKSTVGRTLLYLYEKDGGEIYFKGKKIETGDDVKELRRNAAMVFQDPHSSLNPRMTVSDLIGEPLDIHRLYFTKEERLERIFTLMEHVGLNPNLASRYAHEFSGGQRQRIGIARALAVNPEFIVCDEAVSALDVSVRAQIINTLEDLQESFGLSYLFIAHDLLIVRHISDRIAVMYLGKIVEMAESENLFSTPLHPYTKALISAVPPPDPNKAKSENRIRLTGEIPSPTNVPTGCPFRTRCSFAKDICKEKIPIMREFEKGHYAACHRIEEIRF